MRVDHDTKQDTALFCRVWSARLYYSLGIDVVSQNTQASAVTSAWATIKDAAVLEIIVADRA